MLSRITLSGLIAILASGLVWAAPTLEVTPAQVIEGDAITVRVTGLDPMQTVTLHAAGLSARYPAGMEAYRSRTLLRADAGGTIDLRRDAPLPGSGYSNVDPAGPFWSMGADRLAGLDALSALPAGIFAAGELRAGEVVLQLEIAGAVQAQQVVRMGVAPGVATQEIREPGLTGFFALKSGSGSRPAIVLLGGSEGGLFTARSLAPLLASHGYAVLGVGYFQGGEPELTALPPTLEHIPVETLDAARHWLAAQPGVDAKRIAVVGVSKGAELGLVAATMYPWIDAVAAFAPSHVVWEGIPPDGKPREPRASSWTWAGKSLPFVRWSYEAEAKNSATRKATGRSRLTEPHEESLMIHAADVPAARIPIERSGAALLLVGGIDDGMWPSALSVRAIAEATHAAPAGRVVEIELLETGHQVLGTGWSPTTTFNRPRGRLQGGNPELDAAAQAEGWAKLLGFLERQLGLPGRSN